MRPPVETVRVGKQARDQLMKLRRQTGIEHWNVLCRLAFCASVREKTPPIDVSSQKLDGGVEMTWKVFAGEQSDIYAALCWQRVDKDGFSNSSDGASNCLRAHLHRGLAFLASGTDTKSISDLVTRWMLSSSENPSSVPFEGI